MDLHNIAWRPADEAPTMVPLLLYWCPFPDAEDVEERPEFWGVGVCQRKNGVDHWFMYCPTWEGGLGNPYQGAPDFFAPLCRPDGNPKWAYGYRNSEDADYDPVAYLMGGNSTVPLKVDGSEAIRWIDCDSGECPNEGECVLGAVRWNGWEWSPVRYKSGAFYSLLADDDKPLKFIEHWARVPMEALP